MAPGWLTIIAATLAVALIPQTSSEHSRSPSLAHTRAPSLANSHAPSSDDHKYNIDDLITDDYEELLEYCYGDRYEQEDDNKIGQLIGKQCYDYTNEEKKCQWLHKLNPYYACEYGNTNQTYCCTDNQSLCCVPKVGPVCAVAIPAALATVFALWLVAKYMKKPPPEQPTKRSFTVLASAPPPQPGQQDDLRLLGRNVSTGFE